jgi:hypothetical protein
MARPNAVMIIYLVNLDLNYVAPSKADGSLTLPPASPNPATGRLYDQPANCCCMVCESIGPSTYESVGASDVNSRSKLAVSIPSAYLY